MAKIEGWVKTYDGRYGIQYRRRKDYLGVRIDTFKPSKYGYDVVVNQADNYPFLNKSFKRKESAVKFAINYMRSHPHA